MYRPLHADCPPGASPVAYLLAVTARVVHSFKTHVPLRLLLVPVRRSPGCGHSAAGQAAHTADPCPSVLEAGPPG